MTETISLTIDGQAVSVEPGTTLLKAAQQIGKDIPTICFHEATTSNALCRICVVEVEGQRVLQPACIVKAAQDMKVQTRSEKVLRARRTILEMLASTLDLSDAPALLTMLEEYQASAERFPDAERRESQVKDDNPMYVRDYSKCLLCWRCVQVCAEDAQYTFAINFEGRGYETQIGTFFDKAIPETTCVLCGQCVGVCPTGALKPKREYLLEQGRTAQEIERVEHRPETQEVCMIKPDRIVSTTCPYCGVGCTLQLHLKDDFIFKVTSPFDSPVNQGNLCVKGRFGYDYIYHPQRITTPLARRYLLEGQPKPAGREQVFAVSQQGAPIAHSQISNLWDWVETDWETALNLVTDQLLRIYQRDGSDAMAVYCCAKATNEDNYLLQKMFRALFRTNNVDHCTRLCHAGSVVALQQAVGSSAMSNTASQVMLNDVFIVTGSNTTENHPIIALQMKEAVRKNGAKMIVIDPRRIELVDFAEMWLPIKPGTNVPVFSAMAHVIVKEGLVNHEFIAKRTEGYQEFVESLEKFTPEYAEQISGVPAEDIRKAARLYAGAKSAAIYWGMGISQLSHGTASALALVHLAFLTGQIGRDGTGLNPLRGQNNVQGASDMGAMPFHYPGYMRVDDEANARKWEQAWRIEAGGLSRKLGLTTTEILTQAHAGGVRALYIMGENPMMSEPNLNVTREHMREVEFLVAQDIFINESGAFADVLPAVPFAEKEGTFSNTDRRVQRVRAAQPPRGQARPDWQIICDLAKRLEARLGRPSAGWDYADPEQVLREMAAVNSDYAGITYARIEKVGLQYPVPDMHHPGTPTLFKDSFPRGRGKFTALDYVPVKEQADDEYPFILTTGRILEHWHGGTMTRHSALDQAYPEARVEIHPADAEMHGIRDDMPVRVSSRRGEVVLRATVTEKTSVGVVFIPMHFAEAAANLLTNDVLDPEAKIPEFKACAVQMFPARESDLAHPEAHLQRGRYQAFTKAPHPRLAA